MDVHRKTNQIVAMEIKAAIRLFTSSDVTKLDNFIKNLNLLTALIEYLTVLLEYIDKVSQIVAMYILMHTINAT